MDQDTEHLRLLSIFHYIVGGLLALFGCFPIIHLVVGIAIVSGAMGGGHGPPPAFFGWMFITFASVFIAFSWGIAIAMIVAGRKLAVHAAYTYCLVIAGIECFFMPFGTVLGVFTIIVLTRPSVKQLFGVSENGARPARD